jgi:hypothetical protein
MTDDEVYTAFQKLLPSDLPCVEAYLDDVPLPKGDYYQMNILSKTPIAWNQERYDKDDNFKYDLQYVYKIQFDFYGSSSFVNCSYFHQLLMQAVNDDILEKMNLKNISDVQNRCFLQQDKMFQKRYGFDIDVFIVDTINIASETLENIKIKTAVYGAKGD